MPRELQPNLEKLINKGVMGNLATLYPELSPMLWTSIATGKRAFKHGIYGFTEPDPHSGGIRPITNLSRKTKAIWNIFSQTGRKCNVVGWWPSHPAEPINGVMVSNQYQRAVAPIDKPWPVKPGTVHPKRLIRNLADLRWHPQRLETGHLLPFVPDLAKIDQDKDRRLETLAKIICDCCTIQDATLAIMHHEPWDFTAVYFDAIDHFCHAFMNYHPPREDWVQEEDYEIYKHVVESGYHLHDIMLGKLLQEAGQDTTVIIVSDHGFHSDHLRPRHIPREPAGPAAQHRRYGIIVMKGPGIKKDELIFGASLLDICPTILTLYGLPVGRDMDGNTLMNAFVAPQSIDSISSWDRAPGNAGTHPANQRLDPVDAMESINQLVALGYIEKPDENREKAVAQTVRELDYNLARAYMDAGCYVDAAPLFERLLEKWPDQYRFGIQLIACYQALERIADARRTIEDIFKRKDKNVARALDELKEFNKEHADKKPDKLSEKDRHELRRLRSEASYNPYGMEYHMGAILFAEGDEDGALLHLRNAEQADAGQPELYIKLAEVYLKMKQWEEAERNFKKALSLDPDNAEAHCGLCRTYLPRRKNAEAVDAAMSAVGLLFYNPRCHFLLGIALHRLGEVSRALEALSIAISQNPNFPEAHRRLAYLYKWRVRNPEKAAMHTFMALEAAKRIKTLKKKKTEVGRLRHTQGMEASGLDTLPEPQTHIRTPSYAGHVNLSETITIVSGLPRSGTSMMMQMLSAGGLPVLTDDKRKADPDNARGYFEFEPAKRLRQDSLWLHHARGKAVKIIAQLLDYIDPKFNYRIIFMERDMSEVLKSQQRLLERLGKRGADLSEDGLKKEFDRQVARIKTRLADRGIPTLYAGFGRCVEQPGKTAAAVNRFLGGSLDAQAMAAAVEPSLYRQKSNGELRVVQSNR
ncbi:MAG: hypothetical protein C4B58_14180 [Deltaproteobacteria bacterium]|nr:MAG: hypothetical protein C4B58_14180 [Deltaproteobacteria bacterium]